MIKFILGTIHNMGQRKLSIILKWKKKLDNIILLMSSNDLKVDQPDLKKQLVVTNCRSARETYIRKMMEGKT